MAPLKQHVDDSIAKINQDIAGLDNKIGSYERVMAVMELKRALVTVQGMSMGNSSYSLKHIHFFLGPIYIFHWLTQLGFFIHVIFCI